MDKNFDFLDASGAQLLSEILARRNPGLAETVGREDSISRSDAEAIMATISDELTDNLDAEWEPTEYGGTVSELLARFNADRIREWP